MWAYGIDRRAAVPYSIGAWIARGSSVFSPRGLDSSGKGIRNDEATSRSAERAVCVCAAACYRQRVSGSRRPCAVVSGRKRPNGHHHLPAEPDSVVGDYRNPRRWHECRGEDYLSGGFPAYGWNPFCCVGRHERQRGVRSERQLLRPRQREQSIRCRARDCAPHPRPHRAGSARSPLLRGGRGQQSRPQQPGKSRGFQLRQHLPRELDEQENRGLAAGRRAARRSRRLREPRVRKRRRGPGLGQRVHRRQRAAGLGRLAERTRFLDRPLG